MRKSTMLLPLLMLLVVNVSAYQNPAIKNSISTTPPQNERTGRLSRNCPSPTATPTLRCPARRPPPKAPWGRRMWTGASVSLFGRPSAPTKICCRIWYADCWKTVPTLLLCTRFWTRVYRPKTWRNHHLPTLILYAMTKFRLRLICSAQVARMRAVLT